MEGLETLDRIHGLTYALSELARSEDQGALKKSGWPHPRKSGQQRV
jgi:hypothetical protein